MTHTLPPVPPWTLDAQKELLGTESANMCVVRSRIFSFVCICTTVVIPLPFQCGSDPIPSPLGPAFASLSYLIFVIATVQLVSPPSVSITSKQAGQVTLLSLSITSKHAGHSSLCLSYHQTSWPGDSSLCLSYQQTSWPLFSLSQLPANKLATPLSVSVTSKQGQIPKPKQSLMDCMFTYFGVLFVLNNDEHLTSSIN